MDNFGRIKYTYNTLLAEGIVENDTTKKNKFKKYVKDIKESEVLNTQFNVYYNIENKIESDRFKALEYVNECISLMGKFSSKEIKDANLKLAKPVLFEKFEESYDSARGKLHEDITTLILTKKTPKTVDAIVDAKNNIVEFILNNKVVEVNEGYGLPNSVLFEIAMNKFNEEYPDLSESEKTVVSLILDSTENEKSEMYNTTIKECLLLINDKLVESSGDIKEKLLSTKENLLNRSFSNDSFVSDISKVLELKNYLTQK